MLLRYGCDPNVADIDGQTAAQLAEKCWHQECAQIINGMSENVSRGMKEQTYSVVNQKIVVVSTLVRRNIQRRNFLMCKGITSGNSSPVLEYNGFNTKSLTHAKGNILFISLVTILSCIYVYSEWGNINIWW